MATRRRGTAPAIALRLWAVGARFLLVILLARFIPVPDFGLYGLISASAAYVLYILGLDLYMYTTREMIESGDKSVWKRQLRSHFSFSIAMQAVVLPLTLLLFMYELLPWQVLGYFIALVSTEHIVTEIDRVLIAMSSQTSASVVIFIRQGLMPTIAIPAMIVTPSLQNVEFVFLSWILFNVAAIFVGARSIQKQLGPGPAAPIDVQWIMRGLRVCVPMLVATLCLRAFFAIDRQLVSLFAGFETVGVYSLAMGVAAGLTSVLAIGIHQFSYPRLVAHSYARDFWSFHRELKKVWYQTGVLVVAACGGVAIAAGPFLQWVGKDEYIQESWTLLAAMGAVGLYNVSLVPHFALYALRADRLIIVSTLWAFLSWVIAWYLFLPLGAIQAALLSLSIASMVLLLGKQVAYWRIISLRQVGAGLSG